MLSELSWWDVVVQRRFASIGLSLTLSLARGYSPLSQLTPKSWGQYGERALAGSGVLLAGTAATLAVGARSNFAEVFRGDLRSVADGQPAKQTAPAVRVLAGDAESRLERARAELT